MSTNTAYRDKQEGIYSKKLLQEIQEVQEVLEEHIHAVGRWFGTAGYLLSEGSLTSYRVTTGATPAYGVEMLMTTGATIPGAYFDFDGIKLTALGHANRLSFIEWYEVTKGAITASTGSDVANERITSANAFVGDERIMLTNLGTVTGPNLYTVYYVGTVNAAWFTLSLTPANADPVLLGGVDSAVSYCLVTRALLSEIYVNRIAVAPDTTTIPLKSRRIPSTSLVSCRGVSAAGASTVDFLIGLHTYD